MTHFTKLFAYKSDGSACVFELAPGEELPVGWSSKLSVIQDPEKRTGEAVSLAAVDSLRKPVRIAAAEPRYWTDETEAEAEPGEPLKYDQDLNQVLPMKRRGRPPGSRNVL